MNTKKIRATSRTADVIIIAVMGIVALFCLLPILNVLAQSFSAATKRKGSIDEIAAR